MGFSNTAMQDAANTIRAKYAYGQIHTAAAGVNGTDNVSSAGREAISWSAATGDGDFGLSVQVDFSGGEPSGPAYSVTIWDADTNGTFGGEFVLTGDTSFNSEGDYSITGFNLNGSAS